MAINDFEYPKDNNSLNQSVRDIMAANFPTKNKEILYKLFKLLDFISQK